MHPDHWGSGLAREAVDRATAAIAAGGEPRALLWCLAANHRALAVYHHLGWRATGREGRAEWPPHPTELQLGLPLGTP